MLLQIQHSLLQSHLQDNRHSLPSLQWDRGQQGNKYFSRYFQKRGKASVLPQKVLQGLPL